MRSYARRSGGGKRIRMAMATDRGPVLAVPAAAALLLWPALWNAYPIVFADTGTYLSQAIHLYAGWDRPVFYSLLILPLHLTLTLWPVVVAQALLTAWVLWLVWRALAGGVAGGVRGYLVVAAALSALTWLPWIVSEIMPDLFTPLLVLAIGLLAWLPHRLCRRECWGLAGLATLCIATQQSSVPLALGLGVFCSAATLWRSKGHFGRLESPLAVRSLGNPGAPAPQPAPEPPSAKRLLHLFAARRFPAGAWPANAGLPPTSGRARYGHSRPADLDASGRAGASDRPWPDEAVACRLPGLPPAHRGTPERFGSLEYAEAAFTATHRARTARPALSLFIPPALAILALCAMNLAAHGRFAISPYGNIFLLARVIGDGPGQEALRHDCPAAGWRLCAFASAMPSDSDTFLWDPGSPLYRAGGPKAVSADADAIIAAALRDDPTGEARAALANFWTQLCRFASGDGLQPWPAQVSPRIARDFPASEDAAYRAARQQRGVLSVPAALGALHAAVALAGVLACVLLLGRRRLPHAHAAFLLTVLLSLPLNAAITGILSAPHDRYQARIMWLPAFAAAAILAGRRASEP
jgi:hypothetical protein